VVRYVCSCLGTNPFCPTCGGERYYYPKGSAEEAKADSAQNTTPTPNDKDTTDVDTE